MKQAKTLVSFFLPALFIALLLQACENDLNKVQQIAAKENSVTIDTTIGVDIVYSDSARVKAHVLTPMLLHYYPDSALKAYYQMPKGIKIIFYDGLKQIGTITADMALTSNSDNMIELHRNVVVTSSEGDTFKSNELIWDRLKKIKYSNLPCVIDKVDGTHLEGSHFKSNDNFTDYTLDQANGTVITKGNLTN